MANQALIRLAELAGVEIATLRAEVERLRARRNEIDDEAEEYSEQLRVVTAERDEAREIAYRVPGLVSERDALVEGVRELRGEWRARYEKARDDEQTFCDCAIQFSAELSALLSRVQEQSDG